MSSLYQEKREIFNNIFIFYGFTQAVPNRLSDFATDLNRIYPKIVTKK